MQIASFKKHIVTECACCGELLWAEPAYNLDAIDAIYKSHLAFEPKCQEYHDKLPKFEDVKGILKEGSG